MAESRFVATEPRYVLYSVTSRAGERTLGHPRIQYSYADDSPLTIVPSQDEVLVLDYADPASKVPTARSISKSMIVTGVKAEAALDEASSTIYVVEAIKNDGSQVQSKSENQSARAALDKFKVRNAVLREALNYPGPDKQSDITPSEPS